MQLSRTYMIALGAVVALAAAWMLVIRPHSQSSSNTGASSPAAPGVNGLAHAVDKAHGAVALSQRNAAQLAAKSAAASSSQVPGHKPVARATAAHTAPATHSGAKPVFHPTSGPKPAAAPTHPTAPASRAAEVTGPIAQGKVVVILFWDQSGADDQAVRHQLAAVSHRNGRVVVLEATPNQVASFGSVTRGVQIMETPTTLVINRRGQAAQLTGLVDSASIEQAVVDAQRGAGSVQSPSFSSWTTGSTRSQYIGRADNVCRTIEKSAKSSGTLAQQITSFHALVQVAVAQISKVRAVPEPVADRAVLNRWYGQLDRSMSEFDSAVSAVMAHRYTPARALLFQGQADWDRSSQGLANYGLSACFRQASITS